MEQLFNISSIYTFILCIASWIGASSAYAGSNQIRLLATGSSTVAPVMAEIARNYEKVHPDVRIDVQTGGSSRGIADVINGLSDLGMVSRELKASESKLHVYTIARDGIAVITHKNNPVKVIDHARLQQIFSGRVRDWSDVGGIAGLPIVVVNKSAAHSTLELFLKYLGLAPDQVRADIIIGDNQQGLKTIAGNKAAIGYVSIGAALEAQQQGASITMMRLDGVEPTIKNVRAGNYPITRPLNIVVKDPSNEVLNELLAFTRSGVGASIIESLSFVPVK